MRNLISRFLYKLAGTLCHAKRRLAYVNGRIELAYVAGSIDHRPRIFGGKPCSFISALVILVLCDIGPQLRAGTITAWGYDYYGQVRNAPSGNNFTKLAAYSSGAVALRSDGSIVVWGDDAFGQVSNAPNSGVYKQYRSIFS